MKGGVRFWHIRAIGNFGSGAVLTSRLGRSDPGQGGSGSASTDAPHDPLGTKPWEELPDPTDLILAVPFDGAYPAELAMARRVLQAATQRLNEYISGGNKV
jgi:hypothetical protein